MSKNMEEIRLNRPWRVETLEGKLLESFDTFEEAEAYRDIANQKAADLKLATTYCVVPKGE